MMYRQHGTIDGTPRVSTIPTNQTETTCEHD